MSYALPTKIRVVGSTADWTIGTGEGRVVAGSRADWTIGTGGTSGSKSVHGPRQVGHSVTWPAGVLANQPAAQDEHIVCPQPTMRTSTLASMQIPHSVTGDGGGVTIDGAH